MALTINIEELINGKTVERERIEFRFRDEVELGEFLKERHLTEGRSTGIPTIIRELEKNNSPAPRFETDDERSYFKTTLKIHPEFLKIQIERSKTEIGDNKRMGAPQAPPKYPKYKPRGMEWIGKMPEHGEKHLHSNSDEPPFKTKKVIEENILNTISYKKGRANYINDYDSIP